ncbi:fructokinase [Natronoarchaeum philippinense]|uniref:Fructokinase n=1 Tax=Natronoarchaeum philippinense TaxID=558529 RepID=A0A285P511_NATPI|nr:carbohydrate kinase [Natronoarchaeum philippinense]SNZ16822.1 fructokinase [Natronoarchaeum philippinense]
MSERSLLVVGETLVDMLPETPGELHGVESFQRRAGGAPANVAARLAAFDADPLFWTRVGDDAFGDFLVETLADRGVATRFVEQDADAKTTLAFVAHDEERDRSFTFYRDRTADTRLETGAVPTTALEAIEWVYVGGVALAAEPARSAVLDLLERAREADCSVYFDPNWRPELWDDDETDVLRDAVGMADVLKATGDELAELGYQQDSLEARCEAACRDGPHTVFLTRGGEGATAFATEDAPWEPTFVERSGFDVDVVDTTGAGDAFVAATVAALDRGVADPGRIVDLANASAALSATTTGAMEAPPDWTTIAEFAATNGTEE